MQECSLRPPPGSCVEQGQLLPWQETGQEAPAGAQETPCGLDQADCTTVLRLQLTHDRGGLELRGST